MERPKETRRTFFKHSLAASAGLSMTPALIQGQSHASPRDNQRASRSPEWRNRQSEMAYRMYGSSGMMVSEIVQGTTRWDNDSYIRVFEAAFDRGVNYIDTAPAYQRGQAEKIVGKYLQQSGNRDHLFVSDKI
ncbi:MAG: aldo/keto reductase, partial [Verrucomicrobiae bacterium]|nr:aldo/keto reductase [Verrucomicrobiae bacterium]